MNDCGCLPHRRGRLSPSTSAGAAADGPVSLARGTAPTKGGKKACFYVKGGWVSQPGQPSSPLNPYTKYIFHRHDTMIMSPGTEAGCRKRFGRRLSPSILQGYMCTREMSPTQGALRPCTPSAPPTPPRVAGRRKAQRPSPQILQTWRRTRPRPDGESEA